MLYTGVQEGSEDWARRVRVVYGTLDSGVPPRYLLFLLLAIDRRVHTSSYLLRGFSLSPALSCDRTDVCSRLVYPTHCFLVLSV
ncbi:hypothetical protein VTK56DRAFT_4717 [Thermocarpiscus australiensis]